MLAGKTTIWKTLQHEAQYRGWKKDIENHLLGSTSATDNLLAQAVKEEKHIQPFEDDKGRIKVELHESAMMLASNATKIDDLIELETKLAVIHDGLADWLEQNPPEVLLNLDGTARSPKLMFYHDKVDTSAKAALQAMCKPDKSNSALLTHIMDQKRTTRRDIQVAKLDKTMLADERDVIMASSRAIHGEAAKQDVLYKASNQRMINLVLKEPGVPGPLLLRADRIAEMREDERVKKLVQNTDFVGIMQYLKEIYRPGDTEQEKLDRVEFVRDMVPIMPEPWQKFKARLDIEMQTLKELECPLSDEQYMRKVEKIFKLYYRLPNIMAYWAKVALLPTTPGHEPRAKTARILISLLEDMGRATISTIVGKEKDTVNIPMLVDDRLAKEFATSLRGPSGAENKFSAHADYVTEDGEEPVICETVVKIRPKSEKPKSPACACGRGPHKITSCYALSMELKAHLLRELTPIWEENKKLVPDANGNLRSPKSLKPPSPTTKRAVKPVVNAVTEINTDDMDDYDFGDGAFVAMVNEYEQEGLPTVSAAAMNSIHKPSQSADFYEKVLLDGGSGVPGIFNREFMFKHGVNRESQPRVQGFATTSTFVLDGSGYVKGLGHCFFDSTSRNVVSKGHLEAQGLEMEERKEDPNRPHVTTSTLVWSNMVPKEHSIMCLFQLDGVLQYGQLEDLHKMLNRHDTYRRILRAPILKAGDGFVMTTREQLSDSMPELMSGSDTDSNSDSARPNKTTIGKVKRIPRVPILKAGNVLVMTTKEQLSDSMPELMSGSDTDSDSARPIKTIIGKVSSETEDDDMPTNISYSMPVTRASSKIEKPKKRTRLTRSGLSQEQLKHYRDTDDSDDGIEVNISSPPRAGARTRAPTGLARDRSEEPTTEQSDEATTRVRTRATEPTKTAELEPIDPTKAQLAEKTPELVKKTICLKDSLPLEHKTGGEHAYPSPAQLSSQESREAILFESKVADRHTNKEFARALEVLAFHASTNHLPFDKIKEIYCGNTGSIMNIPFTELDVENAIRLFGLCPHCLIGKTRAPSQLPVELPTGAAAGSHYEMDIMFVDGEPILVIVDLKSNFKFPNHLKGKAKSDLVAAGRSFCALRLRLDPNLATVKSYFYCDHEATFSDFVDQIPGAERMLKSTADHANSSERAIGVSKEATRCRLSELKSEGVKVPKMVIPKLVINTFHVSNVLTCKGLSNGSSPNELHRGVKIEYKDLINCQFGQVGFAYKPGEGRRKNDAKAEVMMIVGFEPATPRNLIMYNPETKALCSRSKFKATKVAIALFNEAVEKSGVPLYKELHTSNTSTSEIVEPLVHAVHASGAFDDSNMSYSESIEHFGLEATDTAAKLEINNLVDTYKVLTFKFPPKMLHTKAIPSKMFFTAKYKSVAGQSVFDRLKCRLVAGGHRQKIESHTRTSSPTVATSSVLTVLSLAKLCKGRIFSGDIPAAYLNASLPVSERQKMVFQKGLTKLLLKLRPELAILVDQNGCLPVYVIGALYGLQQAGACFYALLSEFLVSLGLTRSLVDACVFFRYEGDKHLMIAVHVDDLLGMCNEAQWELEFCNALDRRFGSLKWKLREFDFLGMHMAQQLDFSVRVDMSAMTRRIMERWDVTKTADTPHTADLFTNHDIEGDYSKNATSYVSQVSTVMFLIRIRLDILMTVTYLASSNKNPGPIAYKKLKRLMEYLNGTADKYSVFGADTADVDLFADASYAVHENSRSHSGIFVRIGTGGSSAVMAKSKIQGLVTGSSTESELYTLAEGTKAAYPIARSVHEWGFVPRLCIRAMQDNQSTLIIASGGEGFAGKSKHFRVRYHILKEMMAAGELIVMYCPTEIMLADFMTKPLPKARFLMLVDATMGLTMIRLPIPGCV